MNKATQQRPKRILHAVSRYARPIKKGLGEANNKPWHNRVNNHQKNRARTLLTNSGPGDAPNIGVYRNRCTHHPRAKMCAY